MRGVGGEIEPVNRLNCICFPLLLIDRQKQAAVGCLSFTSRSNMNRKKNFNHEKR